MGNGKFELHAGDSLRTLAQFENDSVDSLVTDPPAGISFMGKDWDADKGGRDAWIAWLTEVMRECHRVLKPGAHGLVWALPRTSHWTATALENAGFEVRDRVQHIFGSGFPKSLDVSKAIDKAAGAEREVVGKNPNYHSEGKRTGTHALCGDRDAENYAFASAPGLITAPATDAARQWSGWGTALKPAREDWWLVRKPLSEKTVAANVQKWGTGALNIDGTRIGENPGYKYPNGPGGSNDNTYGKYAERGPVASTKGRFPSHLILDEESAAVLDAQSGTFDARGGRRKAASDMGYCGGDASSEKIVRNDTGGASRFFYVAKASRRERNAGLEGMPERRSSKLGAGIRSSVGLAVEGTTSSEDRTAQNHHPTVKPIALMRYLCRLVTPPAGLVLDPFTGSGTTGVAAVAEGFRFVGIEREKEYVDISKRRIENGSELSAAPSP